MCIELIPKFNFGYVGLELMKHSFQCIPVTFPAKYSAADMIALLAKYLIHMDESKCIAH